MSELVRSPNVFDSGQAVPHGPERAAIYTEAMAFISGTRDSGPKERRQSIRKERSLEKAGSPHRSQAWTPELACVAVPELTICYPCACLCVESYTREHFSKVRQHTSGVE